MNEDNNTKAARIKRGDTLDYYNDSLPKKAVESLFDKEDKPSNAYIAGYEDDDDYDSDNGRSERRIVIQDELAYRDKSRRNTDTTPDESLEENIAMYSKQNTRPGRDYQNTEGKPHRNTAPHRGNTSPRRPERVKQDTRPKNDQYDDDDDGDIRDSAPGRPAGRRSEPEYDGRDERPRRSVRPRTVHDNPDDAEYNTAPRVREDLPGRATLPRKDYAGQTYSEDTPANGGEARQRRAADPRRSTASQERAGSRAHGSRLPQADARHKYAGRQTKNTASRLFDEDADSDSPISLRAVVIGVAAVLILGVFIMLIVRINSLNAENSELKANEDELARVRSELQRKTVDNEELSKEISRLETQIDEYKNQQYIAPPPDDPLAGGDDVSSNGSTAPPANQPGSNTPVNQQRIHTVKSGEYLSTIAQNYGISVAKLKEANNLTSDLIHVGDNLIIPDAD